MKKSIEFLEYTAKLLVKNPDQVKVESTTDEMGVLLMLHVAPEDMGLIIGRGGSTIQLIRDLLRMIGMNEQAKISLKVAEPEGGKYSRDSSNTTSRRTDPLDEFRNK